MKRSYNIHEAKTHFSKLLEQIDNGNEIIIARSGEPIAKLVPFREPARARVPGSAKGAIEIGKNFDAPLPKDLLKSFFE